MAEKYRRQAHINAVLSASEATHKTRTVLLMLCMKSEFDTPYVWTTKPQLVESTGVTCERHIQRILKELRDCGTIEPVSGQAGGRGNAVKYKLHARNYHKPRPSRKTTAEAQPILTEDMTEVELEASRRKTDRALISMGQKPRYYDDYTTG